MSSPRTQVLADLVAEGDALEALVAPLDETGWRATTPAAGWSVAHQVAHLAWTDEVAVAAATGDDAWERTVRAALEDPTGFVDREAAQGATAAGAELLDRWRRARRRLAETLRDLPEGTKIAWFGPPMSATSMATARLMETWAHGLDVAQALGRRPAPTARLRHVAHLGVRTRDFAFGTHRLQPPVEEFRVELDAPDGGRWTWGPEQAAQSVRGSAYDFCLLVTQRAHRADLALEATGPDADRWLDIAQAFAGPPGEGRAAVARTPAGDGPAARRAEGPAPESAAREGAR